MPYRAQHNLAPGYLFPTLLSVNFSPALSNLATANMHADPFTGQAHLLALGPSYLPFPLQEHPTPLGSFFLFIWICAQILPLRKALSNYPIYYNIAPCYSLSSYLDLFFFIVCIATWHYSFICVLPVFFHSSLNSMILSVLFTAVFLVPTAVPSIW